MAVITYTGLPGSGKSYRVVGDLLGEAEKWYVVHNIEGLDVGAFGPSALLKTVEEVRGVLGLEPGEEFFSVDVQDRLVAAVKERYGRPVLIVIDEAQNEFGTGDAVKLKWMAYHRHLDQTVWLVTQNQRNIHRSFTRLIELEIRAKKGAIFPWFIYIHRAEGERVGFTRRSKEKRIFNAYKSFDIGAGKQVAKSRLLPYLAICACLVAAGGYWLTSGGVFNTATKAKEARKIAAGSAPIKKAGPGQVVETEKTVVQILQESIRFAGWGPRSGAMLYDGQSLFSLASWSPASRVIRADEVRRELVILHPQHGKMMFDATALWIKTKIQGAGVRDGSSFLGKNLDEREITTAFWMWAK